MDSEPGKSRFRIDLPGPLLPIDAVEVQVASPAVLRKATISEPRLTNREIIPVPLGSAEDLTIPIRNPTGRELFLTFDDANNPPLAITAIFARVAFPGSTSAPKPRSAPAPLGAAIDRNKFRFSRPLAGATAGLAVLPLDAEILSRSHDLADVRIVDAAARQVPYIVERRDEPLKVTVKVSPRKENGNLSTYRIALPYNTLPPATRLVIRTNAHVFERNVTLWSAADLQRGRERRQIASATWRNRDPEIATPSLVIDAPMQGTSAVELEIDEGDNAPLPIASGELLLRSYSLRFHNPGGALHLVYGNPAATTPRYDLALIAPRLFTEPAREMSIARTRPVAQVTDSKERKISWVVIAGAVVVLAFLLRRLLTATQPEKSGPAL